MIAPTGYAGYRNVIVNTTEKKEEILLMLYERALIAVRIARRGIEEKKPKLKGENISRVLTILTELDCALDREMEEDLVENLSNLYQYMMNRLAIANVKNDTGALDEVERLLRELKDGFDEAAKKVSACQPVIEKAQMQGWGRIAV